MFLAILQPSAQAQQKDKWKDYRDPEKATITFYRKTDRAISEKFIIWDMRGFNSPMLKEKDIAKGILGLCADNQVDPAFVVAFLRSNAKYGTRQWYQEAKSPFGIAAPKDTPYDETISHPDLPYKCLKFGCWSDGINAALKVCAKYQKISDLYEGKPGVAETQCLLIRKIQYIDTKMGWRYKWDETWEKVDEMLKK